MDIKSVQMRVFAVSPERAAASTVALARADCETYWLCLRLIDSCITQLQTQGPSRTCNQSKEEALALYNYICRQLLPEN